MTLIFSLYSDVILTYLTVKITTQPIYSFTETILRASPCQRELNKFKECRYIKHDDTDCVPTEMKDKCKCSSDLSVS